MRAAKRRHGHSHRARGQRRPPAAARLIPGLWDWALGVGVWEAGPWSRSAPVLFLAPQHCTGSGETPIGSFGVRCPPITVACSDWPCRDTWPRRAGLAVDTPFRRAEGPGKSRSQRHGGPQVQGRCPLWQLVLTVLAGPTVRVPSPTPGRENGLPPLWGHLHRGQVVGVAPDQAATSRRRRMAGRGPCGLVAGAGMWPWEGQEVPREQNPPSPETLGLKPHGV